ncbi:RluA family pseudouridine synthase [Azonexus sp.]|uniref:RluA family pseudouridine synthase n=1 Tax=Azonexus sp. TaxID=1872668 RepID=UPI0039E6E97B
MSCYQPPVGPLEICHSDAGLIVVNKPSGLLSVPGRGPDKQDCVIQRLQGEYPEAQIAHRLDMSTSGLLVVARGAAMQQAMYRLFRERAVEKRYLAVVAGWVQEDQGEIDLPLICDWPNRPRQMVCYQRGKPSLTRYRVLQRMLEEDCSLVALEPITGRSHQLRVHLAALGHPILGDELYAGAAVERAPRLLLHASELAFVHPQSDRRVHFHSPAPFFPMAHPALTV